MKKILAFIKRETVLMVSLVLAGLSMFLVHPDRKYISYIDWHSITLLFCLMAVMAGFKETGLFRTIGNALLAHVHTTRQLFLVLVLLPFVFSMFITNDVSLITFVPFAIIVLSMSEKEHLIIPVVVMQTIAANLGSMLMPMGKSTELVSICEIWHVPRYIRGNYAPLHDCLATWNPDFHVLHQTACHCNRSERQCS